MDIVPRSSPSLCFQPRNLADGHHRHLPGRRRHPYGRAAPFKRNDQMLEIVPKGVMHFPGTGINDNLADKAKKLDIPIWKFGGA